MRRYLPSLLGISLGLAISGLAGCAANTQNTKSSNASSKQAKKEGKVCKREAVVGSHVPRMVCRDKHMADQERERDQHMIQDIQKRNYYVEDNH